jgi:hypothetical protein
MERAMLKVWTDPDNGPSRQKMMDAYAKECLEHLEQARFAAGLCFRESTTDNAAWQLVAHDITAIIEKVKA